MKILTVGETQLILKVGLPKNQREDVTAAQEAIDSGKAKRLAGSEGNAKVDAEFDRIKDDPSSTHKNLILINNCKSEARKLAKRSKFKK
ncbi:MAG: hypothetical protein L3J39_03865 [Verrucomicrobiales bacterium]|nr:hypothetical protein [Verrucomicrobiales bacterium]